MSNLGTQFTARSAMDDAISAGIFRGRPFGGVSIAWSQKLNPYIRPLTTFVIKEWWGQKLTRRAINSYSSASICHSLTPQNVKNVWLIPSTLYQCSRQLSTPILFILTLSAGTSIVSWKATRHLTRYGRPSSKNMTLLAVTLLSLILTHTLTVMTALVKGNGTIIS